MSESLGLNIRSAVSKGVALSSSFHAVEATDINAPDAEQIIGRYDNDPDSYIVITDRSLRVVVSQNETLIPFADITKVAPLLNWNPEDPTTRNAKFLTWKQRDKRQIRITMISGETVIVPVLNDTPDQPSLDLSRFLYFLEKIAFFANKKRGFAGGA